jgi:hypothetical protein
MFDRERTPEQEERQRLVDNRAWLNQNFASVQESHGDRWIAVLDNGIAASDQDVEKVKQAVASRRAEAVVIRIPVGSIPRPM